MPAQVEIRGKAAAGAVVVEAAMQGETMERQTAAGFRGCWRSSPRRPPLLVKIQGSSPVCPQTNRISVTDGYGFRAEVTAADSALIREVEQRTSETGKLWAAVEAIKGPRWYKRVPLPSLCGSVFGPRPGPGSEPAPRPDDGTSATRSPEATVAGIEVVGAAAAGGGGGGGGGGGELSSTPKAGLKLKFKAATVCFRHNSMVKKMVRKGVPARLRPEVWKTCSGAMRKKASMPPDYYQSLLREMEGRETAATRQIDNDLRRTFPGHPWLDTEAALRSLRRILVAYSWRETSVGYCQGMNYVAAYLLVVLRSEEDAFWVLTVLLEELLLTDCYSENLLGCHVEQRVLKDLLWKKLPKLSTHLKLIGFDVGLVTTEWFLCLFAKSFPTEMAMRLWDVLFNEGAKVLFRVALAIFKLNEPQIMKLMNVGDVVSLLQEFTSRAFDADALLKVAFDQIGSLPMSSIRRKRRYQQPAVITELKERLERCRVHPLNAIASCASGSRGRRRGEGPTSSPHPVPFRVCSVCVFASVGGGKRGKARFELSRVMEQGTRLRITMRRGGEGGKKKRKRDCTWSSEEEEEVRRRFWRTRMLGGEEKGLFSRESRQGESDVAIDTWHALPVATWHASTAATWHASSAATWRARDMEDVHECGGSCTTVFSRT
ncbi:hypothetical protein CBR_g38652 [Chara braunii]|uniref:Rab-GAP TBC domain-containing protein n=1 Tax=Chara braunii TaxID=69332 RepID=A0A388K0P2_CHABU|nr:hypothetical protein CBR_g38652 [Chara braunii]|eukprot:GBG63586.1 hypothetical protein CBR_g38652 [Chara braunii]